MALNTQGIISAVTLAIYVPILFLSFRICSKYGIRERGWLLLVIFALIRVVGGALLIAAELITPAVIGLYIGGYALEASGLSPLLLSTLGLLEITTEGPDRQKKRGFLFRILHLIGLAALVLTIIGVSTGSSNSSTSNTERRVGVVLFALLYVILVGATVMQWANRYHIMRFRKQLLAAISVSLPFLAVRTLYSVLSTFSSSSFGASSTTTPTTDNSNPLAKFNMFTGEWQLYVIMEVVMEFIVVLIYAVAGNMLPLDQDYGYGVQHEADEYPLYRQNQQAYAAPY